MLLNFQVPCKFPGIEFLVVPRILAKAMKCFLLLLMLLRLALPASAWEVCRLEPPVATKAHCGCCSDGQCPCLQRQHSTPAVPLPALPPRPFFSGDANFVVPATETPNFYSWTPKRCACEFSVVEPVGIFDAEVPLYLRHCAQLK